MTGEFGIIIDKVSFDDDMVTPYKFNSRPCIDMTISSSEDTVHVCGYNDWGYLLTDALLPLLRYAETVLSNINKQLDGYDGSPEVIVLGKNEYRAVDILHRLRGLGDPIRIYKGIPIVETDYINKTQLLGKHNSDSELPFY